MVGNQAQAQAQARVVKNSTEKRRFKLAHSEKSIHRSPDINSDQSLVSWGAPSPRTVMLTTTSLESGSMYQTAAFTGEGKGYAWWFQLSKRGPAAVCPPVCLKRLRRPIMELST